MICLLLKDRLMLPLPRGFEGMTILILESLHGKLSLGSILCVLNCDRLCVAADETRVSTVKFASNTYFIAMLSFELLYSR